MLLNKIFFLPIYCVYYYGFQKLYVASSIKDTLARPSDAIQGGEIWFKKYLIHVPRDLVVINSLKVNNHYC